MVFPCISCISGCFIGWQLVGVWPDWIKKGPGMNFKSSRLMQRSLWQETGCVVVLLICLVGRDFGKRRWSWYLLILYTYKIYKILVICDLYVNRHKAYMYPGVLPWPVCWPSTLWMLIWRDRFESVLHQTMRYPSLWCADLGMWDAFGHRACEGRYVYIYIYNLLLYGPSCNRSEVLLMFCFNYMRRKTHGSLSYEDIMAWRPFFSDEK